MARFAAGKAPFLRRANDKDYGTKVIMKDFMIAMLPVILFAWYKNGIQVYIDGRINFLEMLYPLFFIMMGAVMSSLMEGIFFFVTDKEHRSLAEISKKLEISFAAIPGIILALLLPLYTPIWVLMVAAFVATIIGKMIFGGFGHNIFNPALLGYAVVGFTLMGVVNAAGGVFNVSEAAIDAYAGATPLGALASSAKIDFDVLVTPYGGLTNLFVGTYPGALGETSALAILIGGIYLVIRKIIKWYTPVIYVGTVFVLSWLIGIISGEAGLWFPTYSILTGGVMFAAVFMITEPVTTPTNVLGKVFFALFMGVFTVLFRFVGALPEGVGTSLIFLNIFTLPIDKFTAVIRTKKFAKPGGLYLGILTGIVVLVAVYAVIKAGDIYTAIITLGGLM
ncbi:MAG: RnfABCDGE type electron transport complex subunit D [Candidatus Izemoplasmatales bacterium]|jgi:electron transport complex protein RnfD|nr:RnfABCDGE type electron transport complex subunit D [Candidatus Izemoplasmatales bacterium]